MDLPFRTLVVTTDFSPLADAALPLAFRMAHEHQARLLVVSVVEVPPAPNPLYAHYFTIPSPEQREQAAAQVLTGLKERQPKGPWKGLRWEPVVLEGEPSAEIVRFAQECTASAIVMSTHGRTGLSHLLLGSVAERVLRGTTCPVFLVR